MQLFSIMELLGFLYIHTLMSVKFLKMTSSNPISKRHSTAPRIGRSLVENVGFPIRIDLYFSSFGFLPCGKIYKWYLRQTSWGYIYLLTKNTELD